MSIEENLYEVIEYIVDGKYYTQAYARILIRKKVSPNTH